MSAAVHDATPAVFDRWAEVYDVQVNPFHSLERRMLAAMLPGLNGLDVLDAGCGTGRLFPLLRERAPKRVVGVDSSEEMLSRAARIPGVELRRGSCQALPLAEASIDCVVSSFVVSYLASLEAFADELSRVTRPGAHVLLTDVHPETARALQWKRSFRWRGEHVAVQSQGWEIRRLCDVFAKRGFIVKARLEPQFAEAEGAIFAEADKAEEWRALRGRPAIYLLWLSRGHHDGEAFTVTGGRCALSAQDAVDAAMTIGRKTIQRVLPAAQWEVGFDLSGYLILPGLINAHDHLEFGLFPRLGHGPYGNAAEWARDIHRRDADAIRLHRGIPRKVRVWWGGIRNLLAGVTTVCHHNPLSPEMLAPEFPVRVVDRFRWAHSLAIDSSVHSESEDGEQPFIIHAAEGVDEASAGEFVRLCEAGLVDRRTVLVHGVALKPTDMEWMNRLGVALIACPSSNAFLFERLPCKEVLAGLKHIALGSDSPLTACGDLLDELRFAHDCAGLDAAQLYEMVLSAPAAMLRLRLGEGRLAPDAVADFIAMRDLGRTPAESLAGASWRDVELVVRGGQVFLASHALYGRLQDEQRQGLEAISVEGERRWIRAPLATLFREAAPVRDGDALWLGGKRVTYGHAA